MNKNEGITILKNFVIKYAPETEKERLLENLNEAERVGEVPCKYIFYELGEISDFYHDEDSDLITDLVYYFM